MLRESGTDGNGGALEAVVVELGFVLLFDPVSPVLLLVAVVPDVSHGRRNSPTEALVAPLLVSHGFGGDGADMFPCVPRPRLCAQ